MDKSQRRSGSTLTGTQSFLVVHADVVGALQDSPARRQLDTAVADVHTHALAQDTAVLSAAALSARRSHLTAELKDAFLVPIANFARTSLRGTPEFAALTRSSNRKQGSALVAAARAVATTATPMAGAFTTAKFPADFLQQLESATDELDATLKAQGAAKSARLAATQGIASALASGREAVRMLDPVVSRMLRSSELLAAWRSVKRVTRSTTASASAPASGPIAPVQTQAAPPEVGAPASIAKPAV